jgi:hypothetical protein
MSLDPNHNQNTVSAAASALQAVGIAQTNNNPLQQVQHQHHQQVQLDPASQYAQQQLTHNQFYQQQVEQAQRQHQQQQQAAAQHQLLSVVQQQQNYAQQLAQSLPQSANNGLGQGQLQQTHSFQPSAPQSEFLSREELISYVHLYARDNGFGIVISHSNEKAIYFTCELGGSYRNKRNIDDKERKRKLTTRKINCPFSMVANCKKNDQDQIVKWMLRITSNEHNHDKLNLSESFPMLRRRNPEINREIRELYLKGNKPLAIEKILKAKFKNILINREDIYNETRKMKREEKLKSDGLLSQDQISQQLVHHQQSPLVNQSQHDSTHLKDDVFDQNIPNLLQNDIHLSNQYVSALQQSAGVPSQAQPQDSQQQQASESQTGNQQPPDVSQESQQLQNQINQAQYNLQQVNQAIANAQQNPPKQETNLSNIDINLVKHQGLMR